MTLHTAKGLEYPAVFLVGMEDGVFPHLRALGEPDELEEERRICYVGITRARRRLFLSSARRRTLFGATQYNIPSRFLRELPEDLVEVVMGESEELDRSSGLALRGGAWGGRPPRGPGPVRSRGAQNLGLEVGDDVVHAKWGEGVVVEARGEGEDAEATVRFPSVGEKQLLLTWAPLKRA
jgi:ATP-dependent DNA helicase UvrD/PcrA